MHPSLFSCALPLKALRICPLACSVRLQLARGQSQRFYLWERWKFWCPFFSCHCKQNSSTSVFSCRVAAACEVRAQEGVKVFKFLNSILSKSNSFIKSFSSSTKSLRNVGCCEIHSELHQPHFTATDKRNGTKTSGFYAPNAFTHSLPETEEH